MKCSKTDRTSGGYRLQLTRRENDAVVVEFEFFVDATGLAGLIRSIDLATNEGQVAKAIGLRRKKGKKR